MNLTAKRKKEDREERTRRIIEKAYQNARKLKFGKITIFIQDGYAFRIETTESDTGKNKGIDLLLRKSENKGW